MLENKVAWVTGGGTGIGRAAAIKLAELGATVIVSGRREQPLIDTVTQIQQAQGRADYAVLDIGNKNNIYEVAQRLQQKHGDISVLVNNAAINLPTRHWHNMESDDWENVINVNINGSYHCINALLPTMRSNNDGLIVNVASWAGVHLTYLSGAAYSTSKTALIAMSNNLNLEEGHNGIRSTVISPGEVATDFAAQREGGSAAEGAYDIALQPEDVGDTIGFIAQLPKRACINEMVISPSNNRWHTNNRMVKT
ncbi:SDR family oxidoreductase [Colwellia sp. MEBiC06753]